jgi:hypothetical protein
LGFGQAEVKVINFFTKRSLQVELPRLLLQGEEVVFKLFGCAEHVPGGEEFNLKLLEKLFVEFDLFVEFSRMNISISNIIMI